MLSLFWINLQAKRPLTLLKRDSNTDAFLWILGNFLEHLFRRTSAYGCFWNDFSKWLFRTFFLESPFQHHPDLVILHKYQSLLKQSFKHNSVHMPSLNLAHTLSFKPRFHMFIIDGYDRKSKRFFFFICLFVFCLGFLSRPFMNHRTAEEGGGHFFNSSLPYHFHPLHRHLDINRAISAESSPLHIGSSWTCTGSPWFPSASR